MAPPHPPLYSATCRWLAQSGRAWKRDDTAVTAARQGWRSRVEARFTPAEPNTGWVCDGRGNIMARGGRATGRRASTGSGRCTLSSGHAARPRGRAVCGRQAAPPAMALPPSTVRRRTAAGARRRLAITPTSRSMSRRRSIAVQQARRAAGPDRPGAVRDRAVGATSPPTNPGDRRRGDGAASRGPAHPDLDPSCPEGPTMTSHLDTARTERTLIRATGGSERFVLVEMTAPSARREPGHRRPQANLAFVLDRSGSMAGGNKLDLARQGVIEGLRRLDRDDRFCVVVYDNEVDVVVESTLATPEAIELATRSLAVVQPRGSTDLGGGWLRGAEQVATHLAKDGVNRVLLLTDGLANQGIQNADELARHAGALRARGVATSTIGVGNDFDEALLQAMADAGGGHFYFAGSMPEILDHLTSEVGEALDVVARNVALEVTVPDRCVESVGPFGVEQRGGRVRVLVGDMVAGHADALVPRLRSTSARSAARSAPWSASPTGTARSTPRMGRFARRSPGRRGPRRQRRPAPRPRRRPGRRPDLRRASPPDAVKLNRDGRFADAEARP